MLQIPFLVVSFHAFSSFVFLFFPSTCLNHWLTNLVNWVGATLLQSALKLVSDKEADAFTKTENVGQKSSERSPKLPVVSFQTSRGRGRGKIEQVSDELSLRVQSSKENKLTSAWWGPSFFLLSFLSPPSRPLKSASRHSCHLASFQGRIEELCVCHNQALCIILVRWKSLPWNFITKTLVYHSDL